MNNVVSIDLNSRYEAKKCEEKAIIYEEVHHKINEAYTLIFNAHGISGELSNLKTLADNYLKLADDEWLAKRKYEKGEY